MSHLAKAEAVFGSVSRGDSDALSDRDILLVDDDTELLNHRRADLEGDGASVAAYTFKRLEALVSNGALFVQHLKDEAVILRDIGGRLRSILDAFQPKNSYQDEIRGNGKLANLAASWPNTRAGALWATDILYVTTRNFGVLYLAQKGIFLFSYSRVLEALVDSRVITPGGLQDLLNLRWAKSIYRSGEHTPVGLPLAEEMVQRAVAARPDPSFPDRSIGLMPAHLLEDSTELPPGSPTYHRLRNLERSYLGLRAIDPSVVTSKNLAMLLRWIENPRYYAFLASKSESRLIAQMKLAAIGRVDPLPRLPGSLKSDAAERLAQASA
jgi:hypothetical protein